MTEAKRQLRAEAVERLKMLDEHGGGSFEYAILGSDKIAWRYMGKRDALIDLLTDDDASAESAAQDMDNGICVHMCPNDSREKLEADVYRAADEMDRFYCGEKFIDTRKIIGWLDRQAAITEREYWHNCCQNHVDYDDEYKPAIDELTAERDEWKAKAEACNPCGWWNTGTQQCERSERNPFADLMIGALDSRGNELKLQEQVEKLEAERDNLKANNEQLMQLVSTQAATIDNLTETVGRG